MRVLLADDSGLILERLKEMLIMFRQVEIVGVLKNGTDTLEAIKILKPDLVIVDIKMPGMSGLEVLKKIRKEDKRVKFIILTFYSSDYYRKIAIQNGADYFFNKADDFDKVSLVLTEILLKEGTDNKIIETKKTKLNKQNSFINQLIKKKLIMLKKPVKLFFAIALMAGFTTRVMAQSTVTGTTAGAVIITPITLTQVSPLHFGVMAVLTATPGTCVLSTAGVRSATGGVNLSVQSPLATNASYTVAGQANTTYVITLPATITVTHTNLVNTMTIGTLLARTTSSGVNGLTGTLSGSGADAFTIGGTLTVVAAQLAGVYAGAFDVTVAYN